MSRDFETDEEWIIHSINIHGFFFERWCQETIKNARGWEVKYTNYPVEFPTPNGTMRGKESKLDIRAQLSTEKALITLIIECKKNNPDFTNWVFFPKESGNMKLPLAYLQNKPHPSGGWQVERFIRPFRFDQFFRQEDRVIFADEARETKSSYKSYKNNDKTKTSNAAITDACQQVALATQAIISEETTFSRLLGEHKSPQPLPYRRLLFMPTIVTTAKLFCCEFDVKDIDSITGEININKVKLNECPYLLFEFALPRLLQYPPGDLIKLLINDTLEQFVRMPIFIINSIAFPDFLSKLATSSPF